MNQSPAHLNNIDLATLFLLSPISYLPNPEFKVPNLHFVCLVTMVDELQSGKSNATKFQEDLKKCEYSLW